MNSFSDLDMKCNSVYVKQGRSANLEAVLNKITTWDQLTWGITGLCQLQTGGGGTGEVVKQKTSRPLITSGVYSYSLKIQKNNFYESCDGKLLVYSKCTFSSSDKRTSLRTFS